MAEERAHALEAELALLRARETPVSPAPVLGITPTERTEGAQEPREEPFTRDEGEEPERATERRPLEEDVRCCSS